MSIEDTGFNENLRRLHDSKKLPDLGNYLLSIFFVPVLYDPFPGLFTLIMERLEYSKPVSKAPSTRP